MNLEEHYNSLYNNAMRQIGSEGCSTDPLIGSEHDYRRGITLLLRPNADIANYIKQFISNLQKIDPNQYYHPTSDLHLTVMSIISCYPDFELNCINLPDYIDVIEKCIQKENHIEIEFRGITASPSCIMVQGFPSNGTLASIRNKLRTAFKNSGLQQSIDTRYRLETAHITVARFTQQLAQKEKFLEVLETHRNQSFGSLCTNNIELVFNDWYLRNEKVKLLQPFSVGTSCCRHN